MVNFVAARGDLFYVEGGNDRLPQSAFRQAVHTHRRFCSASTEEVGNDRIRHLPIRVATVVDATDIDGMELFGDDGKLLGAFDVVILATPLQLSGVNFFVRGSHFDSHVLSPMHLGRPTEVDSDVRDEDDAVIDSDRQLHHTFSSESVIPVTVPTSASKPYTQVVTTYVTNAKLRSSYLSLDDNNSVDDERNESNSSSSLTPTQILFTESGRNETMGLISSIAETGPDGTYKLFSHDVLTADVVSDLFGTDAIVDRVKIWGGQEGGATPDFKGGKGTVPPPFLLYDGGRHGTTTGGGGNELSLEPSLLYYVNAMETSVTAIEISAIGAEAVAKQVALRMELMEETPVVGRGGSDEEL